MTNKHMLMSLKTGKTATLERWVDDFRHDRLHNHAANWEDYSDDLQEVYKDKNGDWVELEELLPSKDKKGD